MTSNWWNNQYTYNWSTGKYEDYYGNEVDWSVVLGSINNNNGSAWGWSDGNGFWGTGSSGGYFGNGGFGVQGGGGGGGRHFSSGHNGGGISGFFKDVRDYFFEIYLKLTGEIILPAVIVTGNRRDGWTPNKGDLQRCSDIIRQTLEGFGDNLREFENGMRGFNFWAEWGLAGGFPGRATGGSQDVTFWEYLTPYRTSLRPSPGASINIANATNNVKDIVTTVKVGHDTVTTYQINLSNKPIIREKWGDPTTLINYNPGDTMVVFYTIYGGDVIQSVSKQYPLK
jgi:hypothetical protein